MRAQTDSIGWRSTDPIALIDPGIQIPDVKVGAYTLLADFRKAIRPGRKKAHCPPGAESEVMSVCSEASWAEDKMKAV
jgi:hypothetical protein